MEFTTEKKKDNTALYFVYAAAAFFGMQFLLKPKRVPGAAAVVTYPLTDPVATPSPEATDTSTTSKTYHVSQGNWIAESFPLRKGMKGPSIRILQQKLGVTADGAFGTNTEVAVVKKFGVNAVSEQQFKSFTQPAIATFDTLLQNLLPKPAPAKDTSAILQNGSRGTDVYRLQKWLGFKDRKAAKKGEPIADSIFGKQTLAALQKRTGKSTISLTQLNAYTKTVSGLGYLGEILITKRAATVLDGTLSHPTGPYRNKPYSAHGRWNSATQRIIKHTLNSKPLTASTDGWKQMPSKRAGLQKQFRYVKLFTPVATQRPTKGVFHTGNTQAAGRPGKRRNMARRW